MERYVASREWTEKLKKAGWRNPTKFKWSNNYYGVLTFGKPPELFKGEYRIVESPVCIDGTELPAPLTDELLEVLPSCEIRQNEGGVIGKMYMVKSYPIDWVSNKSLPNALSAMVCYLAEQGIIKL